MKRLIPVLITSLLFISSIATQAQQGGMGGPPGPDLSGELLKLFDKHKGFTARMELKLSEKSTGNTLMMPGKLAFSDGKTRFDMNLTEAKGEQIPPGASAQLEQMGMAEVVMISHPKEEISYAIYPGLKAYVKLPVPHDAGGTTAEDYTMEVTELGKEEMSGHDCTKNQVVITGKDGQSQEATVWTVDSMKDFPVRIETIEEGNHIAMQFKDIELSKPSSDKFTPPSDYKEYENMMGLMQEIMMRRMGGNAGAPPGQ